MNFYLIRNRCSTACPDQSKKTKNTLMKIMKIDWGSVEIEFNGIDIYRICRVYPWYHEAEW